jgi:hypothetical protein
LPGLDARPRLLQDRLELGVDVAVVDDLALVGVDHHVGLAVLEGAPGVAGVDLDHLHVAVDGRGHVGDGRFEADGRGPCHPHRGRLGVVGAGDAGDDPDAQDRHHLQHGRDGVRLRP